MSFSIPSSVSDSLTSIQSSTGDMTKVGGEACDVMGTLGASVGGDAIAKAKEAELQIQANIPKISANAEVVQTAIADLGPLLEQADSLIPTDFGGNAITPQNLDDDQRQIMSNNAQAINDAMSSFGSVGADLSASMSTAVTDMASSVEALKPQLNVAVQTISAGGCKGVENQLSGIAEGVAPQLDAIKLQLETKTIPSLEPQVNALLDQAKDTAAQAGEAFEANQGAITEAAEAMKNSIQSVLDGINLP
jgi:hypothetical protein